MASYYVPTVVQTTIPDTDMTPLERLILSHIFSAEPDGDGLYFFAEDSPAECLELDVAVLRDAHRASADADSVLNAIVADRLAEVEAGDTHVELDLSVISWATIFQDVVRRSPTLDEVAVSSAFTCSRMRSDGFGGMATLITVTAILSGSTDEMLAGFREVADAAFAKNPKDTSVPRRGAKTCSASAMSSTSRRGGGRYGGSTTPTRCASGGSTPTGPWPTASICLTP